MKKNMGNTDRLIRLLLAAVFVVLYFNNLVPGVFGIILLILAVIFALTAVIGFCPLYTLFHINTFPKKKVI